jgi:hypothetical protein
MAGHALGIQVPQLKFSFFQAYPLTVLIFHYRLETIAASLSVVPSSLIFLTNVAAQSQQM